MNKKAISINDNIDAALKLDGDPARLREYYDDWAATYDDDVGAVGYAGPRISVGLLGEFLPAGQPCRILDAGCGTGQVGERLREAGFVRPDGFDLSPAMTARALATACYAEVKPNIDIMQADASYAASSYDAILCVGVFTLGHVSPRALASLPALLKPNGLLVVSTRDLYYDQSGFQAVVDELIAANRIELLKQIKNAPYNDDGLAHYWVFKAC